MTDADRKTAAAISRVLRTAETLGDTDLLCEGVAIEEAVAAGIAARSVPLVPPNSNARDAMQDAIVALRRLAKLDAGLEDRLRDKLKDNADKREADKVRRLAEQRQEIAETARREAEKLEQVKRAAAAG